MSGRGEMIGPTSQISLHPAQTRKSCTFRSIATSRRLLRPTPKYPERPRLGESAVGTWSNLNFATGCIGRWQEVVAVRAQPQPIVQVVPRHTKDLGHDLHRETPGSRRSLCLSLLRLSALVAKRKRFVPDSSSARENLIQLRPMEAESHENL